METTGPHAAPEVSPETMETAKASYQRCGTHNGFVKAFYRTFFENCPEAEPRFANTDFERQDKLLRHAIGLLLIFPNHTDDEQPLLARLAERHSRRDLKVDPALYQPFVDSLIETVKQHDPEFTHDTERAWRTTLAPGIEYMKARYE